MYINGKDIEIDENTAIATGKQKEPEANIFKSIEPLITAQQLGCVDKNINDSNKRVYDAWQNQIASIGLNNSLQQYTDYTFKRLPYQTCASYSTDAIIHKAIEVLTEEAFSHGGNFVFADEEAAEDFDINEFNKEFKNEGFFSVAKLAFYNALIFGGSFIYINTNDNDLSKQLYLDSQTLNKFINFKVLEPWQFAPAAVNTVNPIKDDYMEPSAWYVQGAGVIHTSRFIKVNPFPVSALYKPMFNYLGLSLVFFMKDYVAVADTIRQSLGDLFLRFATIIVKAPNHKISNVEGYDRIKHILETRNNLGAVVLAQDEEYVVDSMSLSGLPDIVQHAYELVTATSYVPTVKLLGIEPSGFNSTGEYSIKNFYDNIMAFQKNIITPYLISMAESYVALKKNKSIRFNFEWNALGQLDEREMMEVRSAKLDYLLRLKDADILTAEDVIATIQSDDMTLSNIDIDNLPEPEDDMYEDYGEGDDNDNNFDTNTNETDNKKDNDTKKYGNTEFNKNKKETDEINPEYLAQKISKIKDNAKREKAEAMLKKLKELDKIQKEMFK